MTLNDTNVKINIINIQNIDGQKDTITTSFEGKYKKMNGKYHLIYKETDESGFGGCTTNITADKSSVSMARIGKLKSKMIYEVGKVYNTEYVLPYGVMDIEITTDLLETSLNDVGGEIKINYILKTGNQKINNNLNIQITKKD